jgi:hypothetical protein
MLAHGECVHIGAIHRRIVLDRLRINDVFTLDPVDDWKSSGRVTSHLWPLTGFQLLGANHS